VPGGGVLITGGLAQGVGDAGKVAHVVPGEAGALGAPPMRTLGETFWLTLASQVLRSPLRTAG